MAETPTVKIGHIYAYGDVCNVQAEEAAQWGVVSLSTIKAGMDANSDATEIVVHIHSAGGSMIEGFAIYDYLVGSGKKITTVVEGMCASIATVIFLAGSERKLTENSKFLIHNPWADVGGNADKLRQYADQLEGEQARLLDFYVAKIGADPETIKAYMDEEKFMDAGLCLELKFCTEILDSIKAMAQYRNSDHATNIFDASNKQTLKPKNDKMKNQTMAGFMASIAAIAGEIFGTEIKNASTKLADGTDLFYAEGAELAVDVAVFADAEMTTAAADGDHELENGSVVSVLAGLITEIKEKEDEGAPAENPELTAALARIAELEAANAQNEADLLEVQNSLKLSASALAKVKSDWTPNGRAPEFKKADNGAGDPETTAADFKAQLQAKRASRK